MDHLSNLITSLRNAEMVRHTSLTVPNNKHSRAVLAVLKAKGYVSSFKEQERDLMIELPQPVQRHTYKRVSKPGRRLYANRHEVRPVLRGLGISVISTSVGVLSDDDARRKHVGGEILCEVY
jgi:small subunit ribosomal protein S8